MMNSTLLIAYAFCVLLLSSIFATEAYGTVKRVSTKKYDWELDTKSMLSQSSFKIKPDQLIARCKEVIDKRIGLKNADDLAEDFVFQFPIIGPLTKTAYLKAVGGFQIESMFPDLDTAIHDFRVDPFIPNRVWYTVAFRGTHLGPSPFGKPTGKEVVCPPQVNSLTFNEQGQVIKYTGGYVVDKEIGNSGGMGGLFGPLYAIGKGFPFPEARPYQRSWQFKMFSFVGDIAQKFSKK